MTMPKGWDTKKDKNNDDNKPFDLNDFLESLMNNHDVNVLGLDQFKQFMKDKIEGKDIKFVHVKPKPSTPRSNTVDELRTANIMDIAAERMGINKKELEKDTDETERLIDSLTDNNFVAPYYKELVRALVNVNAKGIANEMAGNISMKHLRVTQYVFYKVFFSIAYESMMRFIDISTGKIEGENFGIDDDVFQEANKKAQFIKDLLCDDLELMRRSSLKP